MIKIRGLLSTVLICNLKNITYNFFFISEVTRLLSQFYLIFLLRNGLRQLQNFILRVLTNIFVLFQSWIELWSLIFMWVPFYLPFSNCTKILELFPFTMQIKVRARAHHHIFTYLDHDGKQYGQGRNQSISLHCKAPYCSNFERRILTILFMSSYFQDSNGWDAKRLCATFLITQKISWPIHSSSINPRLHLGASWRMKHCLPIEDWFLIQNCNNCQMTALFQEA